MKVEVYYGSNGITLAETELPASEVCSYVDLVKTHGFEDDDGDKYKFFDAKVYNEGFVVYVEAA